MKTMCDDMHTLYYDYIIIQTKGINNYLKLTEPNKEVTNNEKLTLQINDYTESYKIKEYNMKYIEQKALCEIKPKLYKVVHEINELERKLYALEKNMGRKII
ncbi:MAG: hypothetical protein IJ848_01960 [Alphaproteobacteria bacterium]|nr:hypothetical protein [Alphaproteobacteria bacterium]